jgi:hypothetical protein
MQAEKLTWLLSFIILLSVFFLGAASASAEQPTDTERIFRSPLPFVSFLEKSLLNIPAARDVTVGDFNGDGHPDLIFHASDPGVIWISVGDGNGSFALPRKYGFGRGFSDRTIGTTLITGDFNGDGRDELITLQRRHLSTETTEATLFLISSSMNGETSLQERRSIPLPRKLAGPDGQYLLDGADIDGDRRKDFVLADRNSPEFFVIKNFERLWDTSSGVFDAGFTGPSGAPFSRRHTNAPFLLLTFDVNNDGMTDIIRIGENTIYTFHGNGTEFVAGSDTTLSTGSVASPLAGLSLKTGRAVFPGHSDRDGFLDLFIITDGGQCWILKNKAGKGFSFYTVFDYAESPVLGIGDFNGDGLEDLVTYGAGRNAIRFLLNNGVGNFRAVERPVRGGGIRSLAVADINGDGLSDIILSVQGTFWGLQGRVLLNISQRIEN